MVMTASEMILAQNRTSYRGTILLNSGGPSESGTQFVRLLWLSLAATVGDSFDLLEFDLRFDCFTSRSKRDVWSMQDSHRLLKTADDHLLNWHIAQAQLAGGRCATTSALEGDITEYMSTASVATDMVNIVEKLGQEKLRYWSLVGRQHIPPAVSCTDTASSLELRHRSRPVLRGHVPRQGRAYDL